MKKLKNTIIIIIFVGASCLFAINEIQAQDEEEEYVICPGWGYKCITITKDTWIGPVTVPVYTKGKDKPAIEFVNKE
jgi:hypothetical protein